MNARSSSVTPKLNLECQIRKWPISKSSGSSESFIKDLCLETDKKTVTLSVAFNPNDYKTLLEYLLTSLNMGQLAADGRHSLCITRLLVLSQLVSSLPSCNFLVLDLMVLDMHKSWYLWHSLLQLFPTATPQNSLLSIGDPSGAERCSRRLQQKVCVGRGGNCLLPTLRKKYNQMTSRVLT